MVHAAYLDVRSDKSETNWLLLDYEVRNFRFSPSHDLVVTRTDDSSDPRSLSVPTSSNLLRRAQAACQSFAKPSMNREHLSLMPVSAIVTTSSLLERSSFSSFG